MGCTVGLYVAQSEACHDACPKGTSRVRPNPYSRDLTESGQELATAAIPEHRYVVGHCLARRAPIFMALAMISVVHT